MASIPKRITAASKVSPSPGTVDRILIGSHNGSSFRLYDNTGDTTTPVTGTYTPATGSSVIEIHAVFGTAINVEVTAGAGNSVDYTVFINGDRER